MTKATVTTEILQPLNVELDLASKITFNFIASFQHVSNLANFRFGEIIGACRPVNSCILQDFTSQGASNAINVRQSDFDPLPARQVNTCNACHVKLLKLG